VVKLFWDEVLRALDGTREKKMTEKGGGKRHEKVSNRIGKSKLGDKGLGKEKKRQYGKKRILLWGGRNLGGTLIMGIP